MAQKVGFTGTQTGMTQVQRESFIKVIQSLDISEFHHGDCIGADAQAHDVVLEHSTAKIIVHPPTNKTKRAFCKAPPERLSVLPEKEYLDRNKDIVNDSTYVIATPGEMHNVLRSGTWSTVRFAANHKRNKILKVIYPDGSIVNYS